MNQQSVQNKGGEVEGREKQIIVRLLKAKIEIGL